MHVHITYTGGTIGMVDSPTASFPVRIWRGGSTRC